MHYVLENDVPFLAHSPINPLLWNEVSLGDPLNVLQMGTASESCLTPHVYFLLQCILDESLSTIEPSFILVFDDLF